MTGWTTFTTADEFAADPAFRHWVRSGQFGQPGHVYTLFLVDHAYLLTLARQAADLLRVTALPTEPLSTQALAEQVEATWAKIRQVEANDAPVIVLQRTWLWRAAAMLLLVGGLGWWVTRPNVPTARTQVASWQVVTNRQATTKPLNLADGSVVWLSPGSTLRYPARFAANRREVALDGEAFFEVHRNARQPFYVKTRQLITRVIGTSFLVRVLPQTNETLVQVRTGKVLVYRNRASAVREPPVSLLPNQELRVAPRQEPLVIQRVHQPSALSERLNEQPFDFTDAPVADVLSALSDAYNLPVDYDPVTFRDCQITTVLTDEPLTEKLAILAEVIGPGTRAELLNNRIQLTGPGCH